MKTNLSHAIGYLLLGCAATVVNAATTTPPTTPPPPSAIILSTPLIHGGAMQASGRCSVFNAGKTGFVLVDVHAEDGQGNILASTDAKNCANKTLAGLRACTMTFKMNTTNDSAVCLAKVNPPKMPQPSTTTPPTTPPPAAPAPVLAGELLDNAGGVLVYTNGVMATPPAPPPPPQSGTTPPPPAPPAP